MEYLPEILAELTAYFNFLLSVFHIECQLANFRRLAYFTNQMGNLGSQIPLKIVFIGGIDRATALRITDSYHFIYYIGKLRPVRQSDFSQGLRCCIIYQIVVLAP